MCGCGLLVRPDSEDQAFCHFLTCVAFYIWPVAKYTDLVQNILLLHEKTGFSHEQREIRFLL